MTLAADINSIAQTAGLDTIAAISEDVGTPMTVGTLRSFTELSFLKDGVYYNKALNTLVITKDGTTLSGFNFSGVQINIQANNVRITNSHFDAKVGNYSINAMAGTKNLTVDHSTFDGMKLNNTAYNDFIISKGENTVIKNNEFLDAPNDAITIQSGQISGNIISGGGYADGAHSDAIWIGATNGPVVISGNVIDWRSSSDAAVTTNNGIRITGELGDVDNVLVTKNIILGGSSSVLVTDGATLSTSASDVGSVTNVKVIGNVVDYGKYFDLYPTGKPSDLVYQNNIHSSGAPAAAGQEAVGIVPTAASMHVVAATSASASVTGGPLGDYLIGGSGNNAMYGGKGDDVLFGGAGRDYITGGAGKNIFYYTSLKDSGIDYIYDFKHGADKIALLDLDGAPTTANGWQWLGSETFTGHAWQLRIVQTSTQTSLQLDTDGDLKADFQIDFKGKVTITTADLILAKALGGSTASAAPIVAPVLTVPVVVAPNALPTITGTTTGSIAAGTTASATGTLEFHDTDSGNVLKTSIKSMDVKFLDDDNVDHAGWLSGAQMDAIKAAFTMSTGSLGGASGTAQWTFDPTKADFSFLGEGDTAEITTKVLVDDGKGGTAVRDVVVMVEGVNDGPVITGSTALNVTETANSSYSDARLVRDGTISFGDLDLNDVHSVIVTAPSNARGYKGNLTASVDQDSTGSGTGAIKWTFDALEKSLDYLGAGEKLTQTYSIQLIDNHGGKTTQDVTITIVGTNDTPTISGNATATIWESNTASTLSAQRTLNYFDADTNDTLTTSVSAQTLKLVTASGLDLTKVMTADEVSAIKNGFSLSTSDLGSNKGTGNWSYLIDSKALDFLGQNDTLTVTSTVKVDDGHGGTAYQDVVVNLRGINDAPVFDTYKAGDAAVTANVVEKTDAFASTAVQQSSGKISFSDADISDSHTVRVTAKGSGYLGSLTASIGHDTTGGNDGDVVWSFKVADGALDKLGAGQTVQQTYTITVSDGKSGTTTQDVTVNLTGASDTFVFQNTALKNLPTFTTGDHINVNAAAFGGNLAHGNLADNYFSQGVGPTEAGHGQFYQDASHKNLYWDADGTGHGNAVLIAKFASAVDMHASDVFIL